MIITLGLGYFMLSSSFSIENNINTDAFHLILDIQHFGQSPLPAYEPAFDWENERSLILGQRIPETPISQYERLEMFWNILTSLFN